MDELVQLIRGFHREYLPAMNLLGNHYLGSEYPVTEARVFFEINANEGCTAAHIARTMNIDKGYVSRIINRYEKDGYIHREESSEDGRAYALYLTEAGRQRAEDFNRKSDAEIGEIIAPLTPEERDSLEASVKTILTLVDKMNTRKR